MSNEMVDQKVKKETGKSRKRTGTVSQARKRKAHPDCGPVRTFVKTLRAQSSQIWMDGRIMVNFSRRGVFRTRSKKASQRLVDDGYLEILSGHKVTPTPWAEPDPRMLTGLATELVGEDSMIDVFPMDEFVEVDVDADADDFDLDEL